MLLNTNRKQSFYAIIPARYASTRFPAKVLATIGDKPLFWHAYNRASASGFFEGVFVAGDDERIEEKAKELGVPYVTTRKDHSSGTDRVREAVQKLNLPENCVIVNVQGDEPFLTKDIFEALLNPFIIEKKAQEIETPCLCASVGILLDPVKDAKRISSSNQVKIVRASNGNALYFSRLPIPFERDKEEKSTQKAPYIGHIGIYAFTRKTLERMANFFPTPLENTEKLEQLRLLENNIPIHISLVEAAPYGVDTQEDLEKARDYYKNFIG